MKKIIALILSALTCMCLVACGNHQKYTIDEYAWVMSSIQSVEENGDFVAYAPTNDTFDKNAYPDAVAMNIICNAKNGSLSVLDKTNHKTYNGSYKVTNNSAQTVIYEIMIENNRGTAVVSVTDKQGEKVVPTMILSIGDYALNFQSE